MNNLKLYLEIPLNLELQLNREVLQFAAYDIERNRLFFASSANFIYTTHLSSFQNGRVWSKSSLPAEGHHIDLEPGDSITSFDYLMEKEALVLGTSSGLLLLYNVDDDATEVVGKVEGGVKCISPSPDGDLLGITTGFGQLLVMTHDWELLYETALEDSSEGVDVREPELMDANPISWRGDGKYFATLSELGSSMSGHKRIKVWERDSGALHSTSESNQFMGAILEWMPSGAKIAAVHGKKEENDSPSIVFFERNGLKRNSFGINEPKDASIEVLKWNCSSDLLAAVVRCGTHESIKIWYFSNNRWYLKYEHRYSKDDGVRFMWDPTKPLQLISWTLGGQVTFYNFFWSTAVMEDSTALVIDDSKILVTPLSLSFMPPPLYLFSLKFPSAVRDMAFYSGDLKSRLAAFLSDGSLCVVELPVVNTWEELEGKEFSVEASGYEMALGSFSHFIWLDTNMLLAVSHYGFSQSNYLSRNSSKNVLQRFYIQEIELMCCEDQVPGTATCSGWSARVSSRNSLDTPVIALASDPTKRDSAFVQFDGGKVVEYASKLGISETFSGRHDTGFLSSCPWMRVVPVNVSVDLKPLLCGLDELGRLNINGRILCNNCSSFSFYSKLADKVVTHLILSTKQDLLFIIDINDVLEGETELKFERPVLGNRRREDENRNFINIWERGAKVIGVVHGDEAAVILQTTRGNLECIYPRKLVVTSIVNALVQQRFREALDMVRRHRIDFNVIVDFCGWQAFLQSAADFVKQVNNLNYITEFVCAMKNENVMETLYKNLFPSLKECKDLQTNSSSSGADNKVSLVLQAIGKALEEQIVESPSRELCILTTLARSDPPALEQALERIRAIRDMELSCSDGPRKVSCPSAEEALKHLLWLSDSDAVFEAALGLYDLNLAAIVALNAQRDPKEFLPYLRQLESMPEALMRYNIDLKLHRFESALRNILAAGDAYFADSMNLIKKNYQLFSLALQLITDPAKRLEVLDAWGDYLFGEKCFEDAASTYLCCSRFEKALKAYRAGGNWSGVLAVAGLMKLGKDEILQLAHELCEELNALGKPGEAARIALEYCGDLNGGINLLINAREWEEALRVSFLHTREDLILEVKNASLECTSNLIGDYKEGLGKVGKYLTRYLAVRQRRLLLAAKLQAEERSINDLDEDTASEASSNFSGMSAYTLGTRKSSATSVSSTVASKARDARRQRKRGKIRPGSAGEELALVEHLKGMSLTEGAKRELKSLLVCLMILGEEESARKLQRAAESFQLSQMAAIKLADDTVSNDTINEEAHTLDNYLRKTRSKVHDNRDAFSWQLNVFVSPSQET